MANENVTQQGRWELERKLKQQFGEFGGKNGKGSLFSSRVFCGVKLEIGYADRLSTRNSDEYGEYGTGIYIASREVEGKRLSLIPVRLYCPTALEALKLMLDTQPKGVMEVASSEHKAARKAFGAIMSKLSNVVVCRHKGMLVPVIAQTSVQLLEGEEAWQGWAASLKIDPRIYGSSAEEWLAVYKAKGGASKSGTGGFVDFDVVDNAVGKNPKDFEGKRFRLNTLCFARPKNQIGEAFFAEGSSFAGKASIRVLLNSCEEGGVQGLKAVSTLEVVSSAKPEATKTAAPAKKPAPKKDAVPS